jgi:exosortase H (IPTLxxWG-CTERM-specific)
MGAWVSATFERIRLGQGDPNHALAAFLLRFVLYLAAGSALILRIPPASLAAPKEATAALVAGLFRVFTEHVAHHRDVVTFDGFAVRIVSECFGLLEMAIFGAAVLAFATTWRKRALGLLLGVPAIYLFNLLRIAMLLVAGRSSPALFEFAHVYFWQATLILVITSLWLLWIRFVVRDETSSLVRD